jgi:VanZ family protein
MLIKDSLAAGAPRAANRSLPYANWSLLCAGVLVLQIFALGSLSFELFEPWDKIFHFLAYAALTLLLWIATDGRRPLVVVVGVMGLGLLDEFRQAAIPARSADVFDFLTDALAALVTGAALFWMTSAGRSGRNSGAKKQCAES